VAVDSSVNITGGSFSVKDDTIVRANRSSILVKGGNFTATDRVSFDLEATPFTVEGAVILAGESSSHYMLRESPLTVRGASGTIQAREYACVMMDSSPLTLENGTIDFNADTCLKATSSPIVVSSGSVLFSDRALLQLDEPSPSLTINGGNLELINTVRFITSIGTSINVPQGSLLVKDMVQLNFDQVTLNVGDNVQLSEFSGLSATASNITIESGVLSSKDDVIVTAAGSNFHVRGGSFTATDRVSFNHCYYPQTVPSSSARRFFEWVS
jgi:hypothetical protein